MNTTSQGACCAFVLTSLLFGPSPAAFADSSVNHERVVTKLADGVYVIRHPDAPDTFPQGNTTVIIGSREVLVVDSCYLPSSAREDIAQIRQWTSLPVRYVLNTHWHPDHQRGNAAYREAYPGVSIIAQHETAKLERSYDGGNVRRYPARVAAMKARLDSGKEANGKPLKAQETIVPGHGSVQYDKHYMESVVELIDFVVTKVNEEVVNEGSLSAQLERVAKVVDTGAFRKRFAGEDASSQEYFDESIEGLIHDAFNQAPK